MDLNNKPNPFEIGNDWQVWKQQFSNYMKMPEHENCTQEEIAYYFIALMGVEAIKGMKKMSFAHPNDKTNVDILIKKFDELYDPPKEVEERHKFFSRKINEKESIERYAADLKVSSNRMYLFG